MHIEILAEDKSGSLVLEGLFKTITADRPLKHHFAVRPHRGKGLLPKDPDRKPKPMASGLLDLLAAKLRAYATVCSADEWLIVVVMDSDDQDPDDLIRQIRQVTIRYSGNLPVVIGLSIEEMESWLLGDQSAIRRAYPDAELCRAKAYRQDSVCGTWEILAAVIMGSQADRLIRLGYPVVGRHKSEWAFHIAQHMDPEINQSPSFQRFYKRILTALETYEKKCCAADRCPSDE